MVSLRKETLHNNDFICGLKGLLLWGFGEPNHASLSLESSQYFYNFYLKDLTWSDDDNMYLGAVVEAQPSPHTSHHQQEEGGLGWAHPLQPSLLESHSQGLGICLPSSGYLVSSFIFSLK